ncbi:MAG: PH domain-containing protein [Alphaproteobacteria bacterium]|nr:PH domain-containing protein [Alphaproteobacteria bacterium]
MKRTFLISKNKKTKKSKDNTRALYVNKTLQPEEEIIYVSRFHWIYTLRSIGPLLAALAVVFGAWLVGVATPFLLILALPVLFALGHFLKRMAYKWTNRVVITNKRLIVQKGWTKRNTMDLGLDRILGHKIAEDAWGQTLGYGKFILVGAGVGEIELPGFMSNPARFRRALTGKKADLDDDEDDEEEAA